MKNLIMVVGIHRSGTSLLTAAIAHLGAWVGDTLGATQDNPKGYFENKEFVGINEKALGAMGYRWDCILFDPAMRRKIPAQLIDQGQLFLDYVSKQGDFAVLKDPRICLMLPFWLDLAREKGIDIKVIFAVRHPFEVCMSAQARAQSGERYYYYGQSFEHTLRLWLMHTYEALRALSGDCLVIGYTGLVRSPLERIQKTAEFCGVSSSSAEVSRFCKEFIDPALYRNTLDDFKGKTPEGLPALALEIFGELDKLDGQILQLKTRDELVGRLQALESVQQYIAPLSWLEMEYIRAQAAVDNLKTIEADRDALANAGGRSLSTGLAALQDGIAMLSARLRPHSDSSAPKK